MIAFLSIYSKVAHKPCSLWPPPVVKPHLVYSPLATLNLFCYSCFCSLFIKKKIHFSRNFLVHIIVFQLSLYGSPDIWKILSLIDEPFVIKSTRDPSNKLSEWCDVQGLLINKSALLLLYIWTVWLILVYISELDWLKEERYLMTNDASLWPSQLI